MKSGKFLVIILILSSILASSCKNNQAGVLQPNKIKMEETEFASVAVVELFTSEGCSSCPPADKLLSQLPGLINNENLFLLSYHVDYWNRLGWTDKFSDKRFSDRQRNYCAQLNSNVYTPQMIVNGNVEFVGSDKPFALQSVNSALKKQASVQIMAENKFNEETHEIIVTYQLNGDYENVVINFALVDKTGKSHVTRGENSGRDLLHINIVRSFDSEHLFGSNTGQMRLQVAKEIDLVNSQIIIFTQNAQTLQVTGAQQLSVEI